MSYKPLNYNEINIAAGHYSPSNIKVYNNKAFRFWERALFQRCQSVLLANDFPEEWSGNVKDFFYYCVLNWGYVSVFNDDKYGLSFQPATLSGFDFYYQPTKAIVSNPMLTKEFVIGKDCEILKLTPDYEGIHDIVEYYAEKLSEMDSAINMAIVNSKFAYFLGARNKGMAEALKKIYDKMQKGEPLIVYDQRILNDTTDKTDPFHFIERTNLKSSYIVDDLLRDFQTIINMFDAEIGIKTVPYQKAERMVTAEAESKTDDSLARVRVWVETLNSSAEVVNKHFGTNISFSLRMPEEIDGGDEDVNGEDNADRSLQL